MKKLLIAILALAINSVFAQKVAHIDMESIVEVIPEFETANQAIEKQAKQWESEVEAKFQSIESMYDEYVQNESRLTDTQKKQKQDAIIQAEKNAKDFREQKFGQEGELNALQEKKLKPIFDQIYDKAEEVAKANGFDYLFDKSAESGWIYLNPEYDLTEKVIAEISK